MLVTDSVKNIGVNDYEINLFESQYILEKGMAYNSYIIIDEKIAIMDSVDSCVTDIWLSNIEKELSGKKPDYIIVQHMEPDHSGSLICFLNKYPEAIVVGNAKTFLFLNQLFEVNIDDRKLVVKEGDKLSLGSHELTFIMAPMIHWPEVMVTYESNEGLIFSADAFGKFGTTDADEDWACEARRYYFNIVGKYGIPVQGLLKKISAFNINKILPLHGPVLTDNLDYYLDLYNKWSSYTPENKGVFIAYASIHGNTKQAALCLAEKLKELGEEKVSIADLSRDDIAECVEDAFRYDRMILCSSSYDGGAFLPMEDFLHHLKRKSYQNRTVALLENGTWAPSAIKSMKEYLQTMTNITILEETVTIKSSLKPSDDEAMNSLAKAVIASSSFKSDSLY